MDNETLRQRAEAILQQQRNEEPVDLEDVLEIVQELRIHQIELELQNDELRFTQTQLEKAQRRYFDLYHLAPVGYLLLDETGKIQEVNLTACDLIGHERQRTLQRSLALYCDVASRSALLDHLDTLFATQERQQTELTLIPRNNREKQVYVHVYSDVFEEAGQTLCRMTLTDVSARVQAEQQVAANEQRFRAFLDQLPAYIAMYDDRLRLQYANPTMLKALNTSTPMYNKTDFDLFPAQTAQHLTQLGMQVLRHAQAQPFESLMFGQDDKRVVDGVRFPVTMADGSKAVGTFAVDVTDRERATQALLESEALLRRSLQAARMGIWEWDIKNDVFYLSPETYAMLELSPAAFDGTFEGVLTFFTPEEARNLRRLAQNAIAQKQNKERYYVELPWQAPDGRSGWLRADGEMRLDEAGESRYFLGVVQDITNRKQLEDDLARSENRYRMLTDLMTDYAYMALFNDDDSIHVDWITQSFERITGHPLDEMRQPKLSATTHPDDLERVIADIMQIKEGVSTSSEFRVRHADGHYIWLHISRRPIFDEASGKVIGFYGAAQDITERKHAELSLRESEARFRLMADHAPVLIWLTDANGDFVYFNQPWLNYTGQLPKQALRDGWYPVVHTDDMAEFDDIYHNASNMHVAFTVEHRLRRADGTYLWYLNQGVPRFDENGEYQGYIGSCLDISTVKEVQYLLETTNSELEKRVRERTTELETSNRQLQQEIQERQIIEQRLVESRRFLQGVLNGQLSQIAVLDETGEILMVNDAWRNFGNDHHASETLSDGMGWNYLQACDNATMHSSNADAKTIAQAIRDMIAGQHDSFYYEYELKFGKVEYWYALRLSRFMQNGQLRIIAAHTSINERKRLENEIQAALKREKELSQLKSRFLSMVSHEFRTPLSVIQSSSEILNRYLDRLPAERRDIQFQKINNQIRRLTSMLNDVSFVNKNQLVGHEIRPTEIHIEPFVQQIADEIDLAYPSEVQIMLEIHQCEPFISDEILLHQIVVNLVSNAVKYSQDGDHVWITCDCRQTHDIVLTIRDEGIGIPESDQAYLFDVFHRATNVGNVPGTGLGLAIVQQAVDVLGGDITFESAENVGTTFTVRLPRRVRHHV